MSNSLHPDQARHYVGPDLCPNCLQRLSECSEELITSIDTILIKPSYSSNYHFVNLHTISIDLHLVNL